MFSRILIVALVLCSYAKASLYDTTVLRDRPVAYLPLSAAQGSNTERDLSGLNHFGKYLPKGSPKKTRLPNGDLATVFDGYTQYLEIPSAPALSIRPAGALTIELWIRPDTLNFPNDESDGFVHFVGKGESGNHEYVLRMYSKTNTASPPRPNRISGYVFNPSGGLGSGSYFQDPVTVGQWIHVVVVLDNRNASTAAVKIYKNGVLRDTTPFNQFDVSPAPGNAPVRIATRNFNSFFRGAIGKVALYNKVLSATQIKAHYVKMVP